MVKSGNIICVVSIPLQISKFGFNIEEMWYSIKC